ncbi:unnamed protein product, partial [Polarella glacialis]
LLALRLRPAALEDVLAEAATVLASDPRSRKPGVLRLIRADGTDGGVVGDATDVVQPGEALMLPSGGLLRPEMLFKSASVRVWALNKAPGWAPEGPEVGGWLSELDAAATAICRLDKGASGLVLATDNEYLRRRLEDEASYPKEYVVWVEGSVTNEELAQLRDE